MKRLTKTRAEFGVLALVAMALVIGADACTKRVPPVARPVPPPPVTKPDSTPAKPPAPPQPVGEPPVAAPAPIREESLDTRPLEELNRLSPLRPTFFDFDSSELTAEAQVVLGANADVLKKYPRWEITIEGHCDERGTAEYNLALGERRAGAARSYLASLGVDAARMKTVSYGKEFPFDPGRTEEAWAKNRRAHFVITAK